MTGTKILSSDTFCDANQENQSSAAQLAKVFPQQINLPLI